MLSSLTLLFESLVLMLAERVPYRGVARITTGLDVQRLMIVCEPYLDFSLADADLPEVRQLTIDETSRADRHDSLTLATNAEGRAVTFVTEGKGVDTIEAPAHTLASRDGEPGAIAICSIDMLAAFIHGLGEHQPEAGGMHWKLLRDANSLSRAGGRSGLFSGMAGPRLFDSRLGALGGRGKGLDLA